MARLDEVQKQKLKEVFMDHDEDGDKHLEVAEFARAFNETFRQRLSPEETDRLFDEWDVDRSGFMDPDEFVGLVCRLVKQHESDIRFLRAFRDIVGSTDANERAQITADDIVARSNSMVAGAARTNTEQELGG